MDTQNWVCPHCGRCHTTAGCEGAPGMLGQSTGGNGPGLFYKGKTYGSPQEVIAILETEKRELIGTLEAILKAGRGLFIALDPREGVGEQMSIVWDRLHTTLDKYAGDRIAS